MSDEGPQQPAPPDAGPQLYNGRYEIHRELAVGGMGRVSLGRDQLLDRPVAIKQLSPQFANDPTFLERFRHEAQAAANLNHPNIVAVYDWFEEGGTQFIVMEYVAGQNLAEVLAAEGPLHADRAADIATDVAAALSLAHRSGMVHRDLKTANILVSDEGQVKVGDWGIAQAFAGGTGDLTQAGMVMGTATYFSPEQAMGRRVDPRSDLYSLGVVLYEMVVGSPPFTGEPVAIAYQHVQSPPTPPSQANPQVPPAIGAIILKLLEKEPTSRYPDAEDLRADLRRYREGHVLPAGGLAGGAAAVAAGTAMMPESGAQPVDVPDHRGDLDETPRRTGVFLFFLVVLLLAVAAGIFFFADRLANDQESSNTQVPVPDVVGQTQDVAVGNLQTAGFQVEVETEENPDVDAGTVISQRPDGATEADDGSTVTIVVSAGEDPVEIPDVTGLMEPAATRQLENAGFEVSAERQTNDDIDEGVVSDTRPAVGNLLAPGETVIIIVSSGPDEVTVPDVSGQSVPSAQNILTQDGCSAANQVSEPSTAFASGIVIRTSPGAGTKVSSNQCNVTLVVSSGPPPTTAPPPTTSPPTT